jgi:hypothetical protein
MDWSHPFINGSPGTSLLNNRRFGDIEISGADRRPCPVCGHPTGDCSGDASDLPNTKLPPQMHGSEPMILVENDITEERQLTPYTKTRVLIHRKGDYVPLSKARELGLVK